MSTGRPREEIARPQHVAIRDNIVRCRHRSCYFERGPFATRDMAALEANRHYLENHARKAQS